jgi:hypothetical protein
MRVRTDDEEGLAISFDATGRGLLIGSAIRVEEGDVLTVTFQVPDTDGEERTIEGRVLRVTPNEDDPGGMWPRRLAIEFDEPVPDMESVIAASASKP